MHLFYRVDRVRWSQLSVGESAKGLGALETLCAENSAPSHPRIASYAGIGGKADFGFILYAAELGQLAQMHRALERGEFRLFFQPIVGLSDARIAR